MRAVIKFLTSVRLAIVLLILIICSSILGTLIPQGRSAEEYLVRYGQLGGLLQRLQFTRLYQSFWYVGLLVFFGLNIIICTLTRLMPKIRRVFRPLVDADSKNIQALKIKEKFRLTIEPGAAKEAVKKELVRRRYKIKESTSEGRISLLARKRVLGWFGSDIVHLGLLVILTGGVVTGLFGLKQSLSFTENQTLPVPRADFSIRLDKFTTEYYPNGSVRDWKSDLTVIEAGQSVHQKTIEVNHPLTYKGYVFYQSGYGWDWQSPALEVWVKKSSDPAYLRKLSLKVGEKSVLEEESLQVTVVRFLPDFVLDENRQPGTRSLEPNNPAAFIEGWNGGEKVFSGWIFAKFPDFSRLHGAKETELSFELKDIKAPQYSVIQISKDLGVPLIWAGCSLLMAGLFLAFYWPTREVRLVIEESGGKSEVTAGGISAKSQEAFMKEFSDIMSAARKTR
ncbi:MAG: cytochrome c biogenesis protein ResB [Clostridiales bacterium]|nr:cytochrome c biogenesis protein ResB [Clostridiales bacterium]